MKAVIPETVIISNEKRPIPKKVLGMSTLELHMHLSDILAVVMGDHC